MQKLILSLLITLGFLLTGCSIFNSNSNPIIIPSTSPDDTKPQSQVEEVDALQLKIDGMSLDEKIGQLVIVGLDGYSLGTDISNLIKEFKVGGVILFSNNVKNSNQLLGLINSLKSINSQNKTPLFISVDEEGGRVSRMPNDIKKLPSSQIIAKKNDSNLSFNIGKVIGEELNLFGFNMDFAPVLDINSNPNNSVIGDRSFGNNVNIVNKLGIKTMEGIISNNVIPVVKHFPGHGDTLVDSHVGLPVVNKDLSKLNEFELLPFKEAIKKKIDTIMVSHILLNKVDATNPSSMSKAVITGILRESLKFQGVVITDDMTMGAIIKYFDIGDASVKSINAGSDIILVCHGYNNELKVINSLKAAVLSNVIKESRLDESVYRVLKLKEKFNINNDSIDSVNTFIINNKIQNLLSR
ncbi:beta-N-acetylhexosaminidase [Clostridium lacusfryxellense]|uniref:beta-N-acetylhexosaminidase n=1 Tax=Clostridium lacusfryxellense TaxID=205328 RepID=UPI001C0D4F6B|nr:beta-N-acetylhexosaminidase [Clostridium lacusfryxellense]MBU3111380.1 beta-N-acetylhexosaminidase [Clostridium lacusfryxellense]